jgi:hypothetical protein
MLSCCQGLLSPSCEFAGLKIKYSPVLVGDELIAIGHIISLPTERSLVPITEYDTGPPGENCFVGTVLKRSLRENAPPLARTELVVSALT